MGFKFDKENAQKTDLGNFINESGIYKGVITSAVEKIYDSGSESISFSFKSEDGKTARYMNIFTTKKDGTPAFGHNQILSLMGLFKISDAFPVAHDNGDSNYDCFCNRPIALALQKINTPNQKYKSKMSILHFLDPVTLQNYKEKTNSLEAKVCKAVIEDGLDETGSASQQQFGYSAPAHTDDDLPF